jgi:predicted DNA-binding protein
MSRFAIHAAMARPKKGEEVGATAYVGARIPKSLRADLDEIAKRNGRDLAKEVREAFEAHVKRSRRK